MGDIGFSELVAIVIIAILIYGKDLPQAARKMANLYTKFRRQLTDIKDELKRQIPDEEIRDLNSTVNAAYSGAEPPPPPASMSAMPSAEHVLLSWSSSEGATSYTVKRSAGAAEPSYVLAMYLTDLSYTDTDIQPGKTYHYVVTASNTAGESGDSEEAVVTLPGGEPGAEDGGKPVAPTSGPDAPPAAAPSSPADAPPGASPSSDAPPAAPPAEPAAATGAAAPPPAGGI